MFFLMFLFVLKKIVGEVISTGELKQKGTEALRIERCDCEAESNRVVDLLEPIKSPTPALRVSVYK